MKLVIPKGHFEAYLFDCDGTIADSMPVHLKAWQEVLALHNCPFSEADHDNLAGMTSEHIIDILNKKYGLKMDPKKIGKEKELRYLAHINEIEGVPAIIELIKGMYGKIPMCVVSGGGGEAVRKTLTHLQLMKYFDQIVTSDDYDRPKPAPDPFLAAAKSLKVPPSACLVFEDAKLGIQSAESAGMQWVLVPTQAQFRNIG